MPVEIGKAPEQRAIFEGGDVGQLRQPDEGQADADKTPVAHRLQLETLRRAAENRGGEQSFRMRAHRRQHVVVIVAPGACRRDHRAVDAVRVERCDQLLMGEAVGGRMARIVDQRHVGREDMHMGIDLEGVGHAASCYF
jgi:hypothetical protein